jgi:ribonuclease PH
MARHDGRKPHEFRPIDMKVGFHDNAEGSVLYRCGKTRVLCTASLEDSLPKWMEEGQGGWLTAEYQMHPRANPKKRESRDGRGRPPKGRTMEIQRLVGRGLRSSLDLKAFGSRMVTIDCDVLEADGGTRTASVTAGFMATAMAIHSLGLARLFHDQVAAISVGYVNGEVLVDLDYPEDSSAQVDMNVIGTRKGRLIEVQSTAEGMAIERKVFDEMLDAGLGAIKQLCELQEKALQEAGFGLNVLLKADG